MQGIKIGLDQASITQTKAKFAQLLVELEKKGKVNINVDIFEQFNSQIDKTQKKIAETKNIKIFNPQDLKSIQAELISVNNTLEKVRQKYQNLGEVNFKNIKFDPITKQMTGFTAEVTKADGVIEKFKYDLIALSNSQNGKMGNAFLLSNMTAIDNTARIRERQLQIEQKIDNTIASQNAKIARQEQIRVGRLGELMGVLPDNNIFQSNQALKDYVKTLYSANSNILSFKRTMDGAGNSQVKMTVLTRNANNEIVRESVIVDKTTNSLYRNSQAIDTNNRAISSFASKLKSTLSYIIPFSTLTGTIYTTINQIRNGIEHLNAMNKSMTNIKMITGLSTEEVTNFNSELGEMANRLYTTKKDLIAGSEEFLRAGHNIQETKSLLEATSIGSAVSGQSSQEMAEQLIAISNGFKMATEDASQMNHVIDVMSTLDNSSATSMKEISTAIMRTASSAQMAGVSFEDLSTYIATVSSVTRRSAETIGESFKTIFARYQDVKGGKKFDADNDPLSNVERDLKKYADISIRSAKGTFKDFDVVLQELGEKWKNLSQVQQSAIAKALAGTQQRETFLVLMNNLDEVDRLNQSVANSAGSAKQKFDEAYGQSTEGKLNKLRNSMQGFYESILNSDRINNVINGLTSLVQWLTTLNESGLQTKILFGALSVASVTLIKNFSMIALEIATTTDGLTALQTVNLFLTGSTEALTVAFTGLKTTLSALVSTPTGIAFLGIATAIGVATGAVIKHINHQKELKAETESLTTSYQNLNEAMKNGSVGSINEDIKKISDKEKELQDLLSKRAELQKKVNNEMKNATSYTSFYNVNKLDKTNAQINELITTLQKAGFEVDAVTGKIKDLDNIQAFAKADQSFKQALQSIDDYNKYLEELQRQGHLSAQSIDEIITKHSNLAPYLDNEKVLYNKIQDAVKQEERASLDAIANKALSNEAFFNNMMTGTGVMFSDIKNKYGIDLENFKTVAQMKQEVNNLLISTLGENWSNFYSTQEEALRGFVSEVKNSVINAYLNDEDMTIPDKTREQFKQAVGYLKIYDRLAAATANAKNKLKDFDTKKVNLGGGYTPPNLSSSKSKSSKSKSPSSSKSLADKTTYIYNGDALNKYDAAIQTINDSLSKTDDIISTISQKISNLQSLESKSNFADIIALENQKLNEQQKKLTQLGTSKTQAQKLQDQIKGEFYSNWSWMKGRDLSKLTETDWTNLYNKYYGKDINFGTGDYAKKREQAYQDGAKKFQELMKNYQSVQELIKQLSDETLKIQEDINSTIKERFDLQSQSFETELDNLNDIINDAQDKLDLFEITDKNNYKEKLSLMDEVLRKNQDYLNKVTQIRDELIKQRNSVAKNGLEWNLLTAQIEEYNEKIDDSTKSIVAQQQAIKDVKEEQLDFISSMEDQIVEALKTRYKKQLELSKDESAKELLVLTNLTKEEEDLIKKGLKTREEIFDDHHQKILDALNEELQSYQDIYDAQIKEIDREEDEDDYNKELNKKQQEKAKLQAQYNSLLLDSSLAAQSKREDLLEQISAKEEEIQEYIHKRSITLRKENLADELKKNKERIQDKIDKENEAYENAKKKYDQEVRALEKSNEEKLKSDKLYAQAREMLMQGNIEALTFLLEKYGSDSEKIFGSMGNKIKQEIVDNLSTAIELVKELKNNSSSINDVSMDDSASREYDMEAYYKDPELKELQQQLIADTLSQNPKYTKEEYQEKGKSILQKYKIHKLGGLNTETGWHWLDGTDTKPELVLNAEQTKAMIGLKDYLPSFLKSIKTPSIQLPKLDLINLSGITGGSPVELKIDRLINIEGNADKSVIPEIKQAGLNSLTQLRQALNKQGIRKV